MELSRRAFLGAGAAALALNAGCAGDPGADFTALLDRLSADILRESPELCTSLGVSEAQAGGPFADRLSDASPEAFERYRALLQAGLENLRRFDRTALAPGDQISLDVVATAFENEAAARAFGVNAGAPYVVSQLTGAYTEIPDFLASQHPLTDRAGADSYLARLSAYARVLDQESARIGSEAAAGYAPPDFAIDRALAQLEPFAATAPGETVLVSALARRLADVEGLGETERNDLAARAETIVRDEVLPAYGRQIEALRAIRPAAVHDAGCWRLPDGEEMYRAALRRYTTTGLSADEIHEMGVELVAQFNSEMDALLRAEGLTRGSVAARVQAFSRRPDQLYPNTDAGREQLLADLNAQVQAITARLPDYFGAVPSAQLEIKRIPAYTEAGAPGGYYQVAALDGSRPGAYYINLRDLSEWPRFSLPTLSYHEGNPGHHWQISIQQESQNIPFIRSAILRFGAYTEGWGLYAEQLADEIGAYAERPADRLGYLQSGAFRASRLVVDTGMHAKRWSREQAIASMVEATGDHENAVTTEIERYAVWPGQATSYMVGRQAINRMRDEAKAALGDGFDIKGFHDAVLVNGSTPLSVTEALVRDWVTIQQGQA